MRLGPDSYGIFTDDRERRLALRDRHRRDVRIVTILALTQVLTQTPWQAVWTTVRSWMAWG